MAAPRQKPKHPGRPDGSVKLTPEVQETILAFIRAGAWDYVASEAAGIDDRTFRDWIARGEGRHPTRSQTPLLKAFAKAVREAKAQSRAAREIEIAKASPSFWLTHAARSQPGRDGWTDPVGDEIADVVDIGYQPSAEEMAQTLRTLVEAGVISPPRCTDAACGCALHVEASDG